MPMQSKFNSKCKDCGTEHKVGDLIDTNINGSWCKLGKNCPVGRETYTESSLKVPKPKMTGEELKALIIANFPDQADIIAEGEVKALHIISLYAGVKIQCERYTLTEPPVIGMVLNNVVKKVLK